ncbi:MAG: nucleotidyltransferase family protein [Defluviitaleaceae bacterium]|nr:nucleotidyltransferase family protein [Defluviitaleaceae bacterium]MCL2837217.1 nucleotidyltransferase family protein [Defluviitaleaceae bacterium]
MSIVGIVAEYNPFHNGHLWQLGEAVRLSGGGRVIAAMSGGFTQRGEPALLDKYARTEMALINGASVVLELPSAFACAGAEAFARGAVRLLGGLGISHLCFGAETEDLSVLRPIAEILACEPAAFKKSLRQFLDGGQSFARARVAAVQSCLGTGPCGRDPGEIMSGPNNILALEYLSAMLKYAPGLTPLPVKRKGAGHDAPDPSDGIASASAIRKLAREGFMEELRPFMPPGSFDILARGFSGDSFRDSPRGGIDNYSSILHYILLNEKFKPNHLFYEKNNQNDREWESVWRHTAKTAADIYPISGIVDAASSKRFTKARVRRVIMRRILGLGPESGPEYRKPAYARVLGFRREDSDLLSQIMEKSEIPVVTNLKNAREALAGNGAATRMLEQDLYAQALYHYGMKDEFSQPMVILQSTI